MKISQLGEILSDEFAIKVAGESANPEELAIEKIKDSDIAGVAFDSREVRGGYVFVAIKGVKTDGHLFIESAVEKGASAVICETPEVYVKYRQVYTDVLFLCVRDARRALAVVSAYFYGRACDKLKIVGITGTKGKTSTSFMLASILKAAGIKTGIIGTNGAYFEDFYEELGHSTPESRDLHRLFAKMLSIDRKSVV